MALETLTPFSTGVISRGIISSRTSIMGITRGFDKKKKNGAQNDRTPRGRRLKQPTSIAEFDGDHFGNTARWCCERRGYWELTTGCAGGAKTNTAVAGLQKPRNNSTEETWREDILTNCLRDVCSRWYSRRWVCNTPKARTYKSRRRSL